MEFQNLIQTQCTFVFLEKEKEEGNLTALDLLAFTKSLFVCLFCFVLFLWGPIDPIGIVCIGKGWAYGPIPSPRIREYPRTTSKGRDKN